MHFWYLDTIPWPSLLRRPEIWPFPNKDFDPVFAAELYQSHIDQFQLAETCGFDGLALGEDHMTAYSLTPNPGIMISLLSRVTTTAKLCVLGFPIPILSPIRVAEECSMLDVLSRGRLIAGFVRGVPQNYAAYNIEPNESKARFDEAVRLIIQAWTSREVFSWRETYYCFPAVSIWPRPLQAPHPPLVFSANSPESAVVGARFKAIIGSIHLYSRNALEIVAKSFNAYRQQAVSDGWQPPPSQFLIGLPTCIADSDSEARTQLAKALDYHFGVLSGTYNEQKREFARTKPGYGFTPVEENPPSLEERLECGLVLCGSPRTVVEQIRRLTFSHGAGIVAMQFQIGNMSADVVSNGMNLFRQSVRPSFQKELHETRS